MSDCEQASRLENDVCVRAREAREERERGEARGAERAPARRTTRRSEGRRREGGGRRKGEEEEGEKVALGGPPGLKVTRLVQKTASRKEVTEDEWEKESRSQPLKHRQKGEGAEVGRILGGEAGCGGEKGAHGLGF